MAISVAQIIFRKQKEIRDKLVKVCAAATAAITCYLLMYFFIYDDGCEELIKFWVLANLTISITFTGLRLAYVFMKQGKSGLQKALSKKADSQDKSSMLGLSHQSSTHSFKLGEDFFSISFFGYILIDRPRPLVLAEEEEEAAPGINIEQEDEGEESPLVAKPNHEDVLMTEHEVA